MIQLDGESLDRLKGESYSVTKGAYAKPFLDGELLDHCIYCNVDLGIAVVAKRALDGGVIAIDGQIIYELVSGNITAEPIKTK